MKWYEDPVYIKMADCPEIQEIKKPYGKESNCKDALVLFDMSYYATKQQGEFYYLSGFAHDYTSNGTVGGYVRIPERLFGCAIRDDLPVAYKWEEVIWLPTQSDLQEMVEWKMYEITFSWLAIHRMYYCKAGSSLMYFHTGKPEDMGGYLTGNSMEQLWLAFCMSEKYGKVWSGEKWTNE